VLEEIRKFSSIKVLMLTMYSEKDVIQKALDKGADGVCLKEHGRDILQDAMLKTVQGERPVFADELG
jgi:DNA-binding NarL/FixJ family response regulator